MPNDKRTSSSALRNCQSSTMTPAQLSPSQPFIFQQYTVREIVTPTKQGSISVKEMSFSMCSSSSGWCPSPEVKQKKSTIFKFSALTSPHSSRSLDKGLLMLPHKSSETGLCEDTSNHIGSSEKPSRLRLRDKITSPPKKLKVDSKSNEQKSRSHLKSPVKNRNHNILRNGKLKKYIIILALLPLLVYLGNLLLVLPFYETIVQQESKNHLEGFLTERDHDRSIPEGKFAHLQESLNEEVHGLHKPISSILSVLDTYLSKGPGVDLPVLLITGPSGVGKSAVTSFLVNNFPPPGKAQIMMTLPLSHQAVLKSFSERFLNLIVIENLNFHSVLEAISWAQNLFNEAMWLNKPVMICFVVNVEVLNHELVSKNYGAVPSTFVERGEILHKKIMSLGLSSHHIYFPSTEEHIRS